MSLAMRVARLIRASRVHPSMRRLHQSSTCRASRPKIAVAVSGGVDSSVALHLLLQQGLDVHGVHMRNWDPSDEEPGACTADQDSADAAAVCAQLKVPFLEFSFIKEYWNRVFEPLLNDYSSGIVPNPDVACNREIKFGVLFERVRAAGFTHLATGHYARVRKNESTGQAELLSALDPDKDQSYFLSTVPQSALQRAMFPLGEITKAETREIAARASLSTADKRESMGICFVGKRRKFGDFLQGYIETSSGAFVSEDGVVIGEHDGSALFTIGQKANIGGQSHKWYVVGKDVAANVVTVGKKGSPSLKSSGLRARVSSWISGDAPPGVESSLGAKLLCRYRHGQVLLAATVQKQDAWLFVQFNEEQQAVQPGQVVAFYCLKGEICLGAGIIEDSTAKLSARPTRH